MYIIHWYLYLQHIVSLSVEDPSCSHAMCKGGDYGQNMNAVCGLNSLSSVYESSVDDRNGRAVCHIIMLFGLFCMK